MSRALVSMVSIVIALAGLGGCKPAAVRVVFSAAAHDYAINFGSFCGVVGEGLPDESLATDERECRPVPAAGTTFELTPDESTSSPVQCRLDVSVLDRCEAPVLTLLQGSQDVELYNDAEPQDVLFTSLSRAFDDDADGFSNYLEWSEGTDPRDAAVVPPGATDL